MPGPKMGPRPADFDEEVVRQSPTYVRWLALKNGETLRYACRDFVKGHGDDEERLMRRIMIARRNNLRDHETLKRARQTSAEKQKKRRVSTGMTDAQVAKEMDNDAVESTRSYRTWMALEDGKEFIYNQKYTKGKEGHDWLLKKNIWRRMRYRRENKVMVEKMKVTGNPDEPTADMAAGIVDNALLASAAAAAESEAAAAAAAVVAATKGTTTTATTGTNKKKADSSAATASAADAGDDAAASSVTASTANASGDASLVNKAVVEAAVAAAENYVKVESTLSNVMGVSNPLEAAATAEALDAAAKLAAATSNVKEETKDDDDEEEKPEIQEV